MKLAFYCNFLNHHQVRVADELYKILGSDYFFIATLPRNKDSLKGGVDYSSRPYCILAGESNDAHEKALELARNADVCVFGACSQEYAVERAKQNDCGLSFEMGERWLKRGLINVLSPTLRRWWMNYMRYYHRKPFYKLCSSAFVAKDDVKLGAYKGRHYKWGYFTGVDCGFDVEASSDVSTSNITPLMWCSRYLMLKHPELPILMAHTLKMRGYHFVLDMFGSGKYEEQAKQLAGKLGVEDMVKFRGSMPNEQLMREMKEHDIFLFTSDRNEGWGAVANESMANGCVLVASDAIGSVPYLVKDGVNGLMCKSASTKTSFGNPDQKALDDLTDKVAWLLDNKEKMKEMQRAAFLTIYNTWSPKRAAQNLLQLIDDLQNGRGTSIKEGLCSKA